MGTKDLIKRIEKLEKHRKNIENKNAAEQKLTSDQRNTVFIIGAGGSKPYGFPTGSELVTLIKQHLSDGAVIDQITKHFSKEVVESFLEKLHRQTILNIDKFLRNNSDSESFKQLGEFLIRSTLQAIKPQYDTDSDWYAYVFDLLRNKANDKSDILNSKLYFITFNYDHVIEWSLRRLLLDFNFSFTADEVSAFLQEKVIHLYGSLDNFNLKTGQFRNNTDIIQSLNQQNGNTGKLYTVYDKKKNTSLTTSPGSILKKANLIYIVGFGFDADNVELLKLNKLTSERKTDDPVILYIFDYSGTCKHQIGSLKPHWKNKNLAINKLTVSSKKNISGAFQQDFNLPII
jgi:hypothetical protein